MLVEAADRLPRKLDRAKEDRDRSVSALVDVAEAVESTANENFDAAAVAQDVEIAVERRDIDY